SAPRRAYAAPFAISLGDQPGLAPVYIGLHITRRAEIHDERQLLRPANIDRHPNRRPGRPRLQIRKRYLLAVAQNAPVRAAALAGRGVEADTRFEPAELLVQIVSEDRFRVRTEALVEGTFAVLREEPQRPPARSPVRGPRPARAEKPGGFGFLRLEIR